MIPMQTLHGRSCCQAWLSPFRCSFLAPAWQIHFVTGICCDSFSRFHSWCHKHNFCVIFLCYLRRDFALKTRSPAVLFLFFYSSSEIVLHNALGPALNKIEVPNCFKNIFLAHFKYIIIHNCNRIPPDLPSLPALLCNQLCFFWNVGFERTRWFWNPHGHCRKFSCRKKSKPCEQITRWWLLASQFNRFNCHNFKDWLILDIWTCWI